MTRSTDSGAGSLRWRVRAVFGISLAIALVAIGLGAYGFGALLDARQQLVDRVDPAIASSERLLAAVVDQETAVRAYVLRLPEQAVARFARAEARAGSGRSGGTADDPVARLHRWNRAWVRASTPSQ